jgi:hypothetical protein
MRSILTRRVLSIVLITALVTTMGTSVDAQGAGAWLTRAAPSIARFLSTVVRGVKFTHLRFMVVGPAAIAFAQEVSAGGASAATVLDNMMTGVHREIALRATSASNGQKFYAFVANRETEPYVAAWRKIYDDLGHVTFFYQDCWAVASRPCSSQEVGALEAIADHIVVVQPPETKLSDFSRVELDRVIEFREGRMRAILVTPAQVRTSVLTSTTLIGSLVTVSPSE